MVAFTQLSQATASYFQLKSPLLSPGAHLHSPHEHPGSLYWAVQAACAPESRWEPLLRSIRDLIPNEADL